jgi:hypothetical protein
LTAQLGISFLEIEEELAKRRQLSTLKIGDKLSSSSNELNGEKGQARDIVAEKVGLSPTTFERAKTVLEQAPEILKEKMLLKPASRCDFLGHLARAARVM